MLITAEIAEKTRQLMIFSCNRRVVWRSSRHISCLSSRRSAKNVSRKSRHFRRLAFHQGPRRNREILDNIDCELSGHAFKIVVYTSVDPQLSDTHRYISRVTRRFSRYLANRSTLLPAARKKYTSSPTWK